MITFTKKLTIISLLLYSLCFSTEAEASEVLGKTLSRELQMNQLKIQQAKLTLQQAESDMTRAKLEYEEAEALFKDKVYTIDKVNKAKQAYEQATLKHTQAKIELEKTRLDLLKDATLITVIDAKKFRGENDEVMASITLRNDSDINKARIVMEKGEGVSNEEVGGLLKINNVIVSLRSRDMSIVGDPFQKIIPGLKYGEQVKLTFRLLRRNAEDVNINIEYLGVVKQYNVFLKKEAVQDLPTISSTQYAQQGELGNKITYDLELERLAKTNQSFSLVVLNLPEEIPFAFLDPRSSARITQLKFTREISKQNLNFELSIPEKLDQELVDAEISFTIIITKQAELKKIFAAKRKFTGGKVPAEEISRLNGNKTELILIPKGTGKLSILVSNSFKEVQQEKEISFKFSIMNVGTLSLRRIKPILDLPLEWESRLEPEELSLLEPGKKTTIAAEIFPPKGTAIGEYSVVMKCEGYSGIETVEAADKDFTVRIAPVSNITGTLILVVILIILVMGIAIASIKISRR